MRKENCADIFILENCTEIYVIHIFIHIVFDFLLCPCKQVFPIRENIFLSLNHLGVLGLLIPKECLQVSGSIAMA